MYAIVYTKKARDDIPLLKAAKLDKKAKALIDIIEKDPYQTPPPCEKLLGDLAGCFSRRINVKHRLVYQVLETEKRSVSLLCGHIMREYDRIPKMGAGL